MANEIKKVRVNGTMHLLDYNSLANRPFGVVTETTVWDETGLSFQESELPGPSFSGEMEPLKAFAAGETYRVTWDGEVYECRAFSLNGGILLGNASIAGMESDDSNDIAPFVIGCFNHMISAGTMDAGTHSVKVIHRSVSRISPEYLPDALQFGRMIREAYLEEQADVEFVSTNVVTGGRQSVNIAMAAEIPVQEPLAAGDAYTVTWDGTEYVCEAYEQDDEVILGNKDIITSGVYGESDVPFVIVEEESVLIAVTAADNAGGHTFRIDHMTVTTLDEKYLPAYLRNNSESMETVLPEQVDVGFSEDVQQVM